MDNDQDIPFGWRSGYSATILDPNRPEDAQYIRRIRDEVIGLEIHDQIDSQLRDLIKLLYPKKPLTDAEYSHHIDEKLKGTDPDNYGNWVYYPWRRSLVHLLPREEFVRVRTIRNAYKITFEEQALLATKKVGVIGLSVGQSAALAVAIERAAGEIRIADFDTLELSNLNRIRSSVCNLGLPKTHMVAREIAELDPYLPVKVFEEGITENNIEAFLTADGPLDLLIEECDSVDIKVLAREHARRLRIPVLMDTSDRGMIDVERYDLDPEYPILHGLIDPSVDFAFLKTLKTSEEKLPYIAPILGIDTMSIRLRASALEVGQSISTWPQLGGDVMQGGALCVQYAKQILLKQSNNSFRVYADEMKSAPDLAVSKHRRFSNTEITDAVELVLRHWNLKQSSEQLYVDEDWFRKIVEIGSRASTPGNTQAFKWILQDKIVFLVSDRSFELAFSDNFGFGSQIGLGCILENIDLYCKSQGVNAIFAFNKGFVESQPNVLCAIRFIKASAIHEQSASLCDVIYKRETTRTLADLTNFSVEEICQIEELAKSEDCRLLKSPHDVQLIRELNSLSETIRMTNLYGFHDLFKEELVWTPEAYEQCREGILIDEMNLTFKDRVGLSIYNDQKVNDFLNEFGGGKGFGEFSKKYLSGDQLICLFTSPSFDLIDLVETGRKIQRFWLLLTKYDFSMHPFTSSVMLSSYLHSDKNRYFTNQREYFSLNIDGKLVFIARINRHSGNEVARSLRKNFEQIALINEA
jgi:molybdopterin/thiamine biosynthesis adenylyltransferase